MCYAFDICAYGCVSVYVCLCMYGVCVRSKGKTEKVMPAHLYIWRYYCWIVYISISFFLSIAKGIVLGGLFKGDEFFSLQWWNLNEAHFSHVSSQNDKLTTYICIIQGVFYWQCPINVESRLIFLSLQEFETTWYFTAFLLSLCCVSGFSPPFCFSSSGH